MPGYEAGKHIQEFFEHDILARIGDEEAVEVMIDKTARDAGNDTTTTLRPGLVLGEIQDGSAKDGRYKEFDETATDGTQLSSDVVVLTHQVKDIDKGKKLATVFRQGTLKTKSLINGEDVDWSSCQRFTLSDQKE